VDVVLPKGSANLIVPILDLRHQSLLECGSGKNYRCTDGQGLDHERKREVEIEKLVGRLIHDHSRSADLSVVILLHYSVGASEGEDLLHSVTMRGKKVLRYLESYQNVVPKIPGRNYPDSMLNDSEDRRATFEEAILAIKSHRTLP